VNALGTGTAFVAGMASFLSPCVLPLLPGYVSFLSGSSIEEIHSSAGRPAVARRAVQGALAFIAGFTLVFTLLGASATALGELVSAYRRALETASGLLMVLLGLHLSGLLPIRWLYYEKRFLGRATAGSSLAASFVMGLAFAFGWTPCIGPILAAILALAATERTVRQGAWLLAVYSLGLGLPFLLTALGLGRALEFFSRFKRFLRASEIAAGIILAAVGALVMSHRLVYLMRFMPRALYRFAL
jgi:cytochrome c-type biogenesis protein